MYLVGNHLPLQIRLHCKTGIFCNLARISGKTDRILTKILSQMYLSDKEIPLNFGSHLDPVSGYEPDSPWYLRLGIDLRSLSFFICFKFISEHIITDNFIV